MFFKTESECHSLAGFLGYTANELAARQREACGGKELVIEYGSCLVGADALLSRMSGIRKSLLWIVEYGIWPSRENMHMFYRFRSSYGELREINAAPGHFFAEFEGVDLRSYLAVVLQHGWGAHLLQGASFPSLFVSHDGWAKLYEGV